MRHDYRKYLDWCIIKFGKSKYFDDYPDLELSKENSIFSGEFIDADCSIVIYTKNINTVETAIRTVIHEYKHYLQNPSKHHDKQQDSMAMFGIVIQFDYDNNPAEITAIKWENKYWEECYRDVVLKKMRFIGDIHGNFKMYRTLITNCEETIQVGDLGLGYVVFNTMYLPIGMERMPGWHRFIRGNHDNPKTCKNHEWYLGEYGYLENKNIFFVGGAATPEWGKKGWGGEWFEDEEQTIIELNKAIDLYEQTKPKIVVAHECPKELVQTIIGRMPEPTRTNQALQTMFEIYQPDYWIFGHYHKNLQIRRMGTQFVCLPEYGVFDLEE